MSVTTTLLNNKVTSPEVEDSDGGNIIIINYIIGTIYVLYIPLIIVPSIFVIAAVILMKKLQNAHNVIILAISVTDLLVGIFVIPVQLLLFIQSSRTSIVSYNAQLCMSLYLASDCIHLVALSILTLLGLDTFTQIQYPLKYRTHISIKKIIVCIISTVIFDVSISVIFMDLYVMKGVRCELNSNSKKENDPILKVYSQYVSGFYALHLLLCLFLGVYVRYRQWNRGKVTTWLLLAFILFYLPTIIAALANKNLKRNDYSMLFARLIGHLFSVTNWMFLCISRPHYKFALTFLLKTNPTQWKNLEKTFRLQRFNRASSHRATLFTQLSMKSKKSIAILVEPPCEMLSQITESFSMFYSAKESEEEKQSAMSEASSDGFMSQIHFLHDDP